ncbi:MAG: hypothetical protein WAV41_01600 [Microgenomates group bacterium]
MGYNENHIQSTLSQAVADMKQYYPRVEVLSNFRRASDGHPTRVTLTVIGFSDTGYNERTLPLRHPRHPGEQSLIAQKRMLDHEIGLRCLTIRPDVEINS